MNGYNEKSPLTVHQMTAVVPRRADRAPTEGYALVVDGRMKAEYADEVTGTKAAEALKAKFPMLQVQIYDAVTTERHLISLKRAASELVEFVVPSAELSVPLAAKVSLRRGWSDAENDQLRTMARTASVKAIAAELSRSVAATRFQASKMGVSLRRPN